MSECPLDKPGTHRLKATSPSAPQNERIGKAGSSPLMQYMAAPPTSTLGESSTAASKKARLEDNVPAVGLTEVVPITKPVEDVPATGPARDDHVESEEDDDDDDHEGDEEEENYDDEDGWDKAIAAEERYWARLKKFKKYGYLSTDDESSDAAEAQDEITDAPSQWTTNDRGDFPASLDLLQPPVCDVLVKVYGSQVKPGQVAMFEETYREAIKWQVAHPRNRAVLDLQAGELRWRDCAEPFGGAPYPISVFGVSANQDVTLAKNERQHPCRVEKTGKGLTAKLKIDEDGQGCFGDTGKGSVKIQKAWEGKGNEVLYECLFEMNVRYCSETRRGGHGNGEQCSMAVWAVARPEEDY